MFNGDELSGFFDFYFAGCDTWLFDVAVAINDWCIDLETGELDDTRVRAFLDAYHAVRPFTLDECAAWKAILRGAALRFWLSRLYDYYLPREAETLTPHDPRHFERILRLRVNKPAPELIGMNSITAKTGFTWIVNGYGIFRQRPFLMTNLFFG